MDFLNEAFKSLQKLNEDTFDLSMVGEQDELKDFLDKDEDEDVITIIDDEAETEEDIKDSYLDKVILDCNICHSLIYKDKDDVILDEDETNANIDEECPYCFSTGDGFKVIGQIKPFFNEDKEEETDEEEVDEDDLEDDNDEIEDEDDEVEVEEEEDKVEESLTEACHRKPFKRIRRKGMDELFDVNAQGQTIGLGLGGGTGISAGPDGLKLPGISEKCEESVGEDLSEYQKWVDYDMKKYGKISHLTNRKIKKAGLEVIKDDHGDYEVIANRPDEDLKESIEDMSLKTDDGTELTMTSGEGGEVTITTKPGCKECEEVEEQQGETIGEIDLGTELDIENNSEDEESIEDIEPEEEEEVEIDDYDEESFDELGESYLKKVYENVNSFKVSTIRESEGNKLFIEGLITFNSGNTKKTNFVFEGIGISKSGKVLFEGFNKEIARANKSFKLNGRVENKKLISESLSYKYNQNKKTINGTVKRG